jgi:hypothetical protein
MERTPTCAGCARRPEQIHEYCVGLRPPNEAVADDETYNAKTGRFWCTDCYADLLRKAHKPNGKASRYARID